MPRPNQNPGRSNGPMGGINDLLDPQLLTLEQFVSAENMVLKGGGIQPRQGYSPLTTVKFNRAPLPIACAMTPSETASWNSYSRVAVDPYNGDVYWTAGRYIFRCDKYGDRRVTVYDAGAGKSLTGLTVSHYNVGTGVLYFLNRTDGVVKKCANLTLPVPWTPADLATPTSFANGIDMVSDGTSSADATTLWMLNTSGAIKSVSVAGGTPGAASFPTSGVLNIAYHPSYILYSTATKIRRCDKATGANQTDVYTYTPNLHVQNPISWDGSKVYFISNANLCRCAIDGTAFEIVFEQPYCDPSGMRIGTDTSYCYVLDYSNALISRSDIDDSTTVKILSAYTWKRSLTEISANNWCEDMTILQVLHSDPARVYYVVWSPSYRYENTVGNAIYTTIGIVLYIPAGYTVGKDHSLNQLWPSIIGIPSLTQTPAATGQKFQTKFGRADFAYQGLGVTSGKGGISITNGDSPLVFNYALGYTKQRVTFGGNGDIVLRINGIGPYDSALYPYLCDQDLAVAWKATLENYPNCNQVRVTKGTDAGKTYFDIEFFGNNCGVDLPLMTWTGYAGGPHGPGMATITKSKTGGTTADAFIVLRPAGLPTPQAPPAPTTISSACPYAGVTDYRVALYSPTLGLYSPASLPNDAYLHLTAYLQLTFNSAWWTSLPAIYTDDAGVCGNLVNGLRVYRRTLGSINSTSATDPDGVGADDNWYRTGLRVTTGLLYSIPVGDTNTWIDYAPNELRMSETAPNVDYIPPGSTFVELLNGRAFYALTDNSNQCISWSLPINPATGDFGIEYRALFGSQQTIDNDEPSDHPMTGLRAFMGMLTVFTNSRAYAANVDNVDRGGITARLLPGVTGCACHWAIINTENMPEIGARLFFPDRRGAFFSFNGNECQRLSDPITNLLTRATRQTWQDTGSATADASWYWGTGVLDTENQRLIFSTPYYEAGASSCTSRQFVYDLRQQGWTTWTISTLGYLFNLRQWWPDGVVGADYSSGNGLGRELVCFSDTSHNLFYLDDDADDNGSPFTWSIKSGLFPCGDAFADKLVRDLRWKYALDGSGTVEPDNITVALGDGIDSASVVVPIHNAVQAVTVTGTGNFTLKYRGQTTGNLAQNASISAVEAALEGLSTIGTDNVVVTGSAGAYTITFLKALGCAAVDLLIGTDVSLAGTGHGVVVAESVKGAKRRQLIVRSDWRGDAIQQQISGSAADGTRRVRLLACAVDSEPDGAR